MTSDVPGQKRTADKQPPEDPPGPEAPDEDPKTESRGLELMHAHPESAPRRHFERKDLSRLKIDEASDPVAARHLAWTRAALIKLFSDRQEVQDYYEEGAKHREILSLPPDQRHYWSASIDDLEVGGIGLVEAPAHWLDPLVQHGIVAAGDLDRERIAEAYGFNSLNQGIGLGGILNDHMLAQAKTLGYTLVVAQTVRRQEPAVRVLRSSGFQIVDPLNLRGDKPTKGSKEKDFVGAWIRVNPPLNPSSS
jgi:hypothetical protein